MSAAEPLFLSRAHIEKLHDLSLSRFGGSGGVRDDGLIDSALASARNTFFYGHGDLFDIAATYAFHLAESQAYLDGNKRTAIGAALVFLDLNGIKSVPRDDELYDAMIAIAYKNMNKADLAGLLRQAAGPPH